MGLTQWMDQSPGAGHDYSRVPHFALPHCRVWMAVRINNELVRRVAPMNYELMRRVAPMMKGATHDAMVNVAPMSTRLAPILEKGHDCREGQRQEGHGKKGTRVALVVI